MTISPFDNPSDDFPIFGYQFGEFRGKFMGTLVISFDSLSVSSYMLFTYDFCLSLTQQFGRKLKGVFDFLTIQFGVRMEFWGSRIVFFDSPPMGSYWLPIDTYTRLSYDDSCRSGSYRFVNRR